MKGIESGLSCIRPWYCMPYFRRAEHKLSPQDSASDPLIESDKFSCITIGRARKDAPNGDGRTLESVEGTTCRKCDDVR